MIYDILYTTHDIWYDIWLLYRYFIHFPILDLLIFSSSLNLPSCLTTNPNLTSNVAYCFSFCWKELIEVSMFVLFSFRTICRDEGVSQISFQAQTFLISFFHMCKLISSSYFYELIQHCLFLTHFVITYFVKRSNMKSVYMKPCV